MKFTAKFILAIVTSLATHVWANEITAEASAVQRVTIYSRGQASGLCDGGPSSWFCYDQIERRSEQDAERDADFQCRMKQGRLEMFSAYCSQYCSPFSIPNNAPSQFVNCYANCTSTCLIESKP